MKDWQGREVTEPESPDDLIPVLIQDRICPIMKT